MSETVEKKFRLFKSSLPTCKMYMKDGKEIIFRFHKLVTADPNVIEFLETECNNGHPYISYDSNNLYASQEELDPVKAYKEKIIRDYLEQQAKFIDPENDMGNSEQGKLNPASTTDIAAVTAGGDPLARLLASRTTQPDM